MKKYRLFTLIVVIGLMLACNLPTAAPVQENPPAGDTAAPATTEASAPPTDTSIPAPSEEPSITPTPTPSVPMVTPIKDAVNCRFAPSTAYESVGPGLAVGTSAQILGKSADGGWWQIQNPAGPEKCWVAASVTNATGNLASVGVVAPPDAFVTDVSLKLKPDSFNLPGCMGPVPSLSFTGTIYVNGPTIVKWYFETEQGGKLPVHNTSFDKYGSKTVNDSFGPLPSKGTFWVRLIITSPNSMMAEESYEIKCP